MGINMLDMKQSNAQTVLWCLHSCKAASIKDLAQMTGLSFATVGTIMNGFVKSREVILGEVLSATGGRPSQGYSFNGEYAHILGLSARGRDGKNIIHASVGNLHGEVIWESKQCFEQIQLTSFKSMIDSVLDFYPTVRILSFSLPGVEHNGIIVSNDYAELEGSSFTRYFEEKYSLPVIVENDVNAAVLGYDKKRKTDSVIVGIYFPRRFGPGAGILINGKILKGAAGYAGEVALLPLGIDWLAIDYENPQEIGGAISKLIATFCYTVNPNDVVLYGDFFTNGVREAIARKVPAQGSRSALPSVFYQKDLDSDIAAGLISQAISVYQSGRHGG